MPNSKESSLKQLERPSVQLLPLGTCAANSNPYQQFSSYLLKISLNSSKSESQILLDAGSKHCCDIQFVNLKRLEMIIFSHSHDDHIRYIGLLIKRMVEMGRRQPLKIICHPTAWKVVKLYILKKNHFRIPSFINYIPIKLKIGLPCLKTNKLKPKTNYSQSYEIPPIFLQYCSNIKISIFTCPAKHSINSVVTKISFNLGKNLNDKSHFLSLVYSPDTSFKSDYLIPFVKDVDYWMLDTTFADWLIEVRYRDYLENKITGEISGHSSPTYSARLCEKAHVKNYIAIHYYWQRFAKDYDNVAFRIKKIAQNEFQGNIIVAKDLNLIELM